MLLSTAVIDIAIKAIEAQIADFQAVITELLQIKGSQAEGERAIRRGAVKDKPNAPVGPRKKKAAPPEPLPKRPAAVRRFVSRADIIKVLEYADGPLTEFKIKERLDELLNVNPPDKLLEKTLNAGRWKVGSKRYRKNESGEWELYEPQNGEDE